MDDKRKLHYLITSLPHYLALIILSVFVFGCGADNPIKLNDIENIQLDQDSTLQIDLNPVEPEETPYTYTIKTPPKYGTLSMGADHRHWNYTPLRNYFGPDSFEFEATDGKSKKSAKASISVREIFIAGRPMSVKFLELTSPVSGELQATWFNSYDIDGDVNAIRYHVHLSTDEDFYPSDDTLVETLQGAVTTTLRGLIEDQTYYIAVLAEDVDGKLSKRIDKQQVSLVASSLVFRDDVEVISVTSLPVESIELEDEEVLLRLSSPLQNMVGKVLQLDEAHDHAFLRLENEITISASDHRYRYRFAEAQEFIQDIAFTLNQGTYDPAAALAEYYQDTAGSLESLLASRSSLVSAVALGSDYQADLLNVLLLEWTQFQNVHELYEFLVRNTTIDIDEYISEEEPCGELSPAFEPLDPLGWRPDPLEFNVKLNFQCKISYTIVVKWSDLLRSAPELLSAEINGSLTTSLDASGRFTQRFNLGALNLPRNMQFVRTKFIKLWRLPIPYTIALNAKGTLKGEAFGEVTGSFGTVVDAGINAGAQYSKASGFEVLTKRKGLYLKTDIPNDTKELISQIDLSSKIGTKLTSLVGPEFILSVANVGLAYKKGFNGVASLSMHVGPRLTYSLETKENPSIVIEKLGASPFGIGTYEWTGNLGGDYALELHLPISAKREFELNSPNITFFHLPTFDIEYRDKQIGSNEFEVEAIKKEFFQWNDADIIDLETNWHVIDPTDATLSIGGVDRLLAQGVWADNYDGNAVIVFEYTPNTLASMVAGLSEITKPIAKQYKILVPGFLLEGEWDFEVVKFDYIFDIFVSDFWMAPELWERCPPLYPIGFGDVKFVYDAAGQSYWLSEMTQTTKKYDLGIVTAADCRETIVQSTLEKPSVFTSLPVNRTMSSDELNRAFVGSVSFGPEYTSGLDPATASFLIASGKIKIESGIEVEGPDQFLMTSLMKYEDIVVLDTSVKFSRANRD